MDPKNPGAVDEIIHLGDYWNEEGMVKYREEVIKINCQVGELFGRAYKYLRAAFCIYEDMAEIYENAVKKAELNRMTENLLRQVYTNIGTADKAGSMRKLFISAITPDGLKSFPETITEGYKCISIKDIPGMNTSKLLEKAAEAAAEKGFNVEGYYCAFIPEKLEHLVIPELSISISTSNIYHDICKAPFVEYDLNSAIDKDILENYEYFLDYDRCEFDELLARAVKTIGEAKALHDLMEKYYIPNMDFESVQVCWESTMDRILGYIGDN